jgi:uracil-DNA glycosylase
MATLGAALTAFLGTVEGKAWCDAVPGFARLARIACQRVEAQGEIIAPAPHQVFAAFRQTPPHAVRVVILGQDPYPTPGHANGLAFSHSGPPPLPRSLGNIFRELDADQRVAMPSGDLTPWTHEGVLLLNTALTVAVGAGGAGSHLKLGWQGLTDAVIAALGRGSRPVAFVLWGNPAQSRRGLIDARRHLIVASAHPSPLSARRGFFGSRPFGQINDWLRARGEAPVNWGAAAQDARQATL